MINYYIVRWTFNICNFLLLPWKRHLIWLNYPKFQIWISKQNQSGLYELLWK